MEGRERRGREEARDGRGGWRGGNEMGVRHGEREMKWGEGKKDRGGEHWLRDPDSQGFTQNIFLSKESQF